MKIFYVEIVVKKSVALYILTLVLQSTYIHTAVRKYVYVVCRQFQCNVWLCAQTEIFLTIRYHRGVSCF